MYKSNVENTDNKKPHVAETDPTPNTAVENEEISVVDSDRKSRPTTTTTTSNSNDARATTIDDSDGTQVKVEKKKKKKKKGDENEERGNWTGKFDFLLALLGYAVGLGNVWRFPYLCYRNGGGAFLIPYTIVLILVGMPMTYLELVLGQFTSAGPLSCWEFAPLFQGIGFAQMVVSGFVAIYYNMILAWAIFYLFSSFIHAAELPWISCSHYWNTKSCYDRLPDVACNSSGLVRRTNGTCTNGSATIGLWDVRVYHNSTNLRRTSASEEYYNNRVLDLSSGIHDLGPVKWDLTLCLLLAWILCFACLAKGIKTSGKVVYFTAIFPYVVLIILLGRGLSLPGASEGVMFFLKPDFSRLKDARVWNDAATQMFFSMGNCWGGIVALASYNRFHNNCLRDTLVVTLTNWATGVFAGFVIFSFLGFMAHTLGLSVSDVVDSGPGLAFIVYPDAVTRLPIAPLWSVLFFLMLLSLGLDSEFASVETILTALVDQFTTLRKYKPAVVGVLCVFFFFLGLPLCTRGGSYMLQLMDTYSSGWAILFMGVIECIALAWIYGCRRLYKDMEVMLGREQSVWWRICWQFLTPAYILFILVFSWADYKPANYGSYVYPKWADAMGWLMSFFSIIWIFLVAGWKIYKELDGTVVQRLRNLTLPTIYWGPALPQHRELLLTYVEGFQVYPDENPGSSMRPSYCYDNEAIEVERNFGRKETNELRKSLPFQSSTITMESNI